MRVCIYGIGAIGGYLGARLARSGCDVSAVARGLALQALRERGLRIIEAGETLTSSVRSDDDPAALGEQDLVIIAVKAPALQAVAGRIAPLLGPSTTVLVAMNGVPWWFLQGFGGRYAGTRLESVDPDGTIAAGIPMASVIGGVVYLSAGLAEPAVVRHSSGHRLIVGEPDGSASQRVRDLAALMTHAGIDAEISTEIQREIWYKLWGNMTMNPISALTGATIDRIVDDPVLRGFCVDAMEEARAIGARIGCVIDEPAGQRIDAARRLGAFRTSMLQDADAGRPMEIDALVGVVRELGTLVGVPTPSLDALFGLTRLFARTRGLYPT